MDAYHNSHDLRDRKPFGAVTTGSQVELGLDVIDPLPGASCFVRLWEGRRGASQIPMNCESWGQTARFTATITVPDEGCILWYSFVIESYDRSRYYYGNNTAGLGGVGQMYESSPRSFQITVYQPNTTPEWFKNGIAYQIFPDRFFRGEDWLCRQEDSRRPDTWKGPRQVLQRDWNDTPFYCRNEKGEITRWATFGGTLEGIREKLMYLKSMGVTVLYLNPIFEATSNHKYDTGDYMKIDPSLGDEESFQALVDEAKALDIHIILDGVFSHTGADSRYFNRLGNYEEPGACQGPESPYYKWYRFRNFPDDYECWWGVTDLPNVEELEPSYQEFIHGGEDSVIRHWLKKGVGGWRLDVADELPDEFIQGIRKAMMETDPDSVLLGEVWEDASNKESYGQLREYFLGKELQSTMNYPFRSAAIDFMLGRLSPVEFRNRLMSLKENYPPENFYGALNVIGSHDRERVLTTLGEAPAESSVTEQQKELYRLPADKYVLARNRLMMLSLIQFTMPGVPCIYYGDEAGLQGYSDPFNRAPYPWGREDLHLLTHYRMLAALRQQYPALSRGSYEAEAYGGHVYGCRRTDDGTVIRVLVNRGIFEHETVRLPMEDACAIELIDAKWLEPDEDGWLTIHLPPLTGVVVLYCAQRPVSVERKRSAGVICHLSAMPGRKGKADLTDGYAFADFLEKAGQKLWQILPFNPVGLGGSPYYSPATFAGDPALIDREREPDWTGYEEFCRENAGWLEDYALFASIKKARGDAPWQEWPEEERTRKDLDGLKAQYAKEMEVCRRDQYWFWDQWMRLKAYANEKGILIIGDVPLGVSDDSVDVWARPELFQLDSRGYPAVTAGVPPDYFTPEGQNWGNPVYDWDVHAQEGYDWWIRRLARAFQAYDFVRVDHFRGFSEYYSIPAGKNGLWGGWRKGPGLALFQAAEEKLGRLPILAEDLGQLDASVYVLMARTGFPGMDVYQFEREKMQTLPPEEARSRVFYASTHDSQTLEGWCRENEEDAQQAIRMLYATHADWVIVQLQDMLGLDDTARFNVPGTLDASNWSWQASPEQLSDETARTYRQLAEEFQR